MNNLEWLWEHERDKLVKLIVGEYDMCDICFYDPNFPDCGGDCERNVREWLLAEHDSNGTCPDGNGTCPNDGLAPENDVSADDVDANDGNAPLEPAPLLRDYDEFLSESCNQVADQREHAETPPVSKWQSNDAQSQVDTMRDVIRDFRDERDEWKAKCETREFAYKQADAERKRYSEQIYELFAERANLAREIGTLRAERDRYRELCGKLLDAADEMRRVRDQFDAFTEVD